MMTSSCLELECVRFKSKEAVHHGMQINKITPELPKEIIPASLPLFWERAPGMPPEICDLTSSFKDGREASATERTFRLSLGVVMAADKNELFDADKPLDLFQADLHWLHCLSRP
ncbi:Hypothetical predicted protein [Cloeon dipterum]|uniref:Uncharacterized protein n=1 Tax=Cloeon dipterum TaxID=197152 RepID=A0A8S1DBR5_9INSE|nr:Hypothetical predicted protein [Cloeon dipterum]